MQGSLKRFAKPVREFWREWSHDNASLLAAGVAFYTTFSLAPLLLLAVFAASLFFEGDAARQIILGSAGNYFSARTTEALVKLATTVITERSSGVTVVTSIVLLFAASAVFRHLRAALDIVMDVPHDDRNGFVRIVIARLIGVAMVIAAIAFLFLTIGVTSLLAVIRRLAPQLATGDIQLWRGIDLVASTLLLAALFATTLKLVPDIRLKWRHVLPGSAGAAVLFAAARFGLGIYLSRSDVTTGYGAAASLAVVLIAVYVAVLALFAAAEVTQLIARRDPEFTSERRRRQRSEGHVPRKESEPTA